MYYIELEEMMVKQRREILWMNREIESQSAEISGLRAKCKELKRQNGKQRRLIEQQKRENSKSMGRVQVLQQMLVQREPTVTRNDSPSNSLEMSITSIAEDVLIDHDGADSPESETGSTVIAKREHPVGDSIEANLRVNLDAVDSLVVSSGMLYILSF